MSCDYKARFLKYQKTIDEALLKFLSHDETLPQKSIFQAMKYSVTAGGKRIRPVLTLELCRMFGGEWEIALPFACALEMIHTYSLIHDDLPAMDDDDLRRGRPTSHKVFGEATAILAGDGLLNLAFETALIYSQARPERTLAALSALARASGVYGMIGGQVLDLENEGKEALGEERLIKTHELKTGALIMAGAHMGAILGGADESGQKSAREFGKGLGLAFQAVDDILDVVGAQDKTGKPSGSDEKSKKATFIKMLGLDEAKSRAKSYTALSKAAAEAFPDNGFLLWLCDFLLKREY